MSEFDRRARLLRAAIGVRGPAAPNEDDWDSWVRDATDGRVLPLLYEIARDEGSELTDSQRERASEYQRDAMAVAVRVEHALVSVAHVLDARSVEFAVLKGAATAHLDYDHPSLRQFGDADLLVSPDDFEVSLAALTGAGWEQAYPLPRYHKKFAHAITLRGGSGVEVDIHQKIAHRALGELVPARDLLQSKVDYSIADHRLSALCAVDRLIHGALHLVASRGVYRRLSSAADVLVMAERVAGSAEAVLSRAASWRIHPLVESGVRASFEAAQLPLHQSWSSAFEQPRPRASWLVRHAYLSEKRRPAFEELAYLRHLDGGKNRLRYLEGYFATDFDYAEHNRRKGMWAQTRYLWSRLRSD